MKLLFRRLSSMKHLLRRLFRMAAAASAKASAVASQLSDTRRLGGDARVPKGHVAICVNEEGGLVERYAMRAKLVGRPTFAAQEYGYSYPGALHIPCPVTDFHDLLQLSSASTCAAADHPGALLLILGFGFGYDDTAQEYGGKPTSLEL